MRKIKPIKTGDIKEVIYSNNHWKLLEKLRSKAIKIMQILKARGLTPIIHGSIARGDIKPSSDIDIVIPYQVPSFKIETALEQAGIIPQQRMLVQATPKHVVKAHIQIDENTTITFPLMELRKLEREFYKFGGELTLDELLENKRVPGVDKRLMLIIPTEKGHLETPVIGREAEVARQLKVSIDIVNERVRVLTRRDEIGRTGVYLKRILTKNESFEEVLKKLVDQNPAIRRRMRL
ncbi:MAG: nucleotidyltransferase domain-containing protein [archaeon GB-1867-035]|nr:nucleotidyltransferase domain-containing protein [Candidatus Culexmicrobium profundum]